jgi:hypothetical protein
MKVMGSRANNANRVHETFFVEVTDSNHDENEPNNSILKSD